MTGKDLERILSGQILFLGCLILGYHSGNMDSALAQKYLQIIASLIANLLAGEGFELTCTTICTAVKNKKLPVPKFKETYKLSLYVLLFTVPITVYCGHSLLKEEQLVFWMAYALVRYLNMKCQPTIITYGEALACSFAEGFLCQVIPPGGDYEGLVEAIRTAAMDRRAAFPVRRLFVVFPRSLHCPRSLEAFNKNDERLPRLEQCTSLPDISRDVAGVCNRVYRNTVYKIRRHPTDPRPVHVVCATPINTLWMVLQKRAVYTPMAKADEEEIAESFCATLPSIIHNDPELRDKCDLVYYDDTKPEENLAEILLAKIQEVEPNYENITWDQ
ncbi:stimulator of interferon genes protein-like [Leguminivora glycinivorella]|uniref:stimulator of interferon genes protein-like n=1 Tax=Leguminivora glycinivorella TaxID=1035111 RepID=UPI00200BB31E|nr:stimulator of interferon genes protein-like [Leguminivora glycinivorella]